MNIKALKRTADVQECESVVIYRIMLGERQFKIAVSKKKANKRTVVKCSEGAVTFIEYTPIAGGMGSPAETVEAYISVSELLEKNTVCMLVISGKPLDIHGLDNGRIASKKSYSTGIIDTQKLYVMSEAAFEKTEL